MKRDSNAVGGDVIVMVQTSSPMLAAVRDQLDAEGFATEALDSEVTLEATRTRTPFAFVVVDDSLSQQEMNWLGDRLAKFSEFALLQVASDDSPKRAHRFFDKAVNKELVISPGTAEELVLRLKAQMLRTGHRVSHADGAIRMVRASGTVTAVFSLKGGVGKSTVAVNLAVGLKTESASRVLLLDADLISGDVGVLLDLKGQYTVADLCNRRVYEEDSLLRMVVRHSSGVDVLLRPNQLRELNGLNTSSVPEIIPVCRRLYDHTIINMSPSIEDMNASLLDAADRILAVVTPEMPSIHAGRRFIELAQALGYGKKTSLVINRAASGIDIASLEKTFDVPVAARIISDGRQVVRAANEGTSLFVLDPKKKLEITRNFSELVAYVLGRKPRPVAARLRPRFISRFLAA